MRPQSLNSKARWTHQPLDMSENTIDNPTKNNETALGAGGWFVTIILCLFFSTVGAFWLKWATFPDISAGLCEAVPPIPAVAALLFLVGMRLVLRRLSKILKISSTQIITVYAFVSVSVSIGFINLYRSNLAHLLSPQYSEDATFEPIRDFIPSWLAPTDPNVVTAFWEKSSNGIPWSDWFLPMLTIGLSMLFVYVLIICMMRFLHERWSEDERLIYPVAEFALNLVEPDRKSARSGDSIFGNKIFWLGALGALIFNLFYIIPALRAEWPVPKAWLNAASYFDSSPWNAVGMWQIRLNPIIFGLGYLVSMDILLSIWVWFLVLKFGAVFIVGTTSTSRAEVFKLGEQQATGAYVVVAASILWAARKRLGAVFRHLLPSSEKEANINEAGPWTLAAFVVAGVGLIFIMLKLGMALWLALVMLAVLLIRALVMMRIRAQAGMPIIYFHVGNVQNIIWFVGGAALAASGMQSVAAFWFMSFLFSATFLAPHHADAFKLAEKTGLGTRRWAVLAVVAVAFGLVLVNLTHVTAFYKYGALNVGKTPSAWRLKGLINAVNRESGPEGFKLTMGGLGAVITGVLTYLRRFYWFPFHPIGYVIACAIGYRVFGPIFAIWLIKWIILKYFGGAAHKKAKNFFLGLVLSHFFIAAVWGALAVTGWRATQTSEGGYFIGFW